MPVSVGRAKQCSERLLDCARSGEPVDMSAFCLHEAQAQLQLALLGLPEEFMDATNADLRRAFSLDPQAEPGAVLLRWLHRWQSSTRLFHGCAPLHSLRLCISRGSACLQ